METPRLQGSKARIAQVVDASPKSNFFTSQSMFVARLYAFVIPSPASAMPSSYAHSWYPCSFPRAADVSPKSNFSTSQSMSVARLYAFIIPSPASAMPSSCAHSWYTCAFPRARTKPFTRDPGTPLFRVASIFAGAVALVNFGLSLWLVMIFGVPFTHLHVMMLPLVQAVSWITIAMS